MIILFYSNWYVNPILLFAESQSNPLSPRSYHLELKGHSDSVLSISYSPDGKTLLSGSRDKSLKLWDSETGKELRTLKGHTGAVWSVSFSPDGKTLLSGSSDKTLKLWDAETGKVLRTLHGHSSIVMSVSFSPDGKSVISTGGDKTIKLWDVATGKELNTFQGHSKDILSISYSPNSKTVLSGGVDKTLKLWGLANGQEILTFKSHSGWIANVSYSPNGKTVLSGGADKTLKLWDLSTGRVIQTLKRHTNVVSSVSYSPDGKFLLSGSYDKTLKLWDLAGNELQTFQGHDREINSASFNPDGRTVASGSNDKTIKIWNLIGIDGYAMLPPVLKIENISFSKNILDAGETAQLSVTLKNIGPGEARGLSVNLSGALRGLSFPAKTQFLTIENGGTATASIEFQGGMDLPTSEASIRIEIVEPYHKVKIQVKRLKFNTRGMRTPELILAKFAVIENRSGAPNNQIDLNEIIAVKFSIQNIGAGVGETVMVEVKNQQKGVVWLGVGEDLNTAKMKSPEFAKIGSGKFETMTYYYFLNGEFQEEKLTFAITASENLGKFGFSETKSVAINTNLEPEGSIRTINVEPLPAELKVVIEDIPDYEELQRGPTQIKN